MTLWLAMSVLLAAALAIAAWPLIRPRPLQSGDHARVYRAQLAEVEREESAGLTSQEDAKLARIEIQRRLIGAPHEATATNPREETTMTPTDRNTLLAVAAMVAIGSAVIYGVVGSAGTPSASRPLDPTAVGVAVDPLAARPAAAGVAPVDEMVVRLESRLKEAPGDLEGWRMLGWSKFRMDDFSGAATAYAKAVELAPDDAETLSSYGEALARAAGGLVTPNAAAVLEKSRKLDPANPRARFLLGLKKQQDGKPKAALDDWLEMLRTAPDNADWYADVRGRVVELATSSGVDVSARLPAPRAIPGGAPDPAAGPTAEEVARAGSMDPASREAMIEGMVARLDARLEKDPRDVDGWVKLIRARRVLGQEALAASALARGSAAFKGDSAALAQLAKAMSSALDLPQQ